MIKPIIFIALFFLPKVIAAELPQAVSNNAVAAVKLETGWRLYSFNGLLTGKDWQAVTNQSFSVDLSSGETHTFRAPGEGRLASIAATVNDQIYLFGGYTVNAQHEEVSTPEVLRFDPKTETFNQVAMMPVPVDDSVALVYQQRYIYLVSGWHNDGNVNAVQIFDTVSNRWLKGTPFPGAAVFGHSAGIVGNQMVLVDGVKVADVVDGKRIYKMAAASYLGEIDPQDPTQITWRQLADHPGKAKYRMAATGDPEGQQIIFAAGSDNPYNYNGIGYDGVPSEPSAEVFSWNLRTGTWDNLPPLKTASMDHRGLLKVDDGFYIVGGMGEGQKVSPKVTDYVLGDNPANTD